jgi:hypothetical protein
MFRSFQPYSSAYASEEGKTMVNLTLTGTMLNAMTQKALSNTTGKIFFTNAGYSGTSLTARDVAKIHNEGRGVPKREFFAVSSQDNKSALNIYQKGVKKALKESGL